MFIAPPEASDESNRIYKSSAASQGFVMNLARAWAWRPDVFEGFAALRGQLTSKSSLTKRDQAVIVCATASQLGDAYCSLAWGRTLSDEAGAASAPLSSVPMTAHWTLGIVPWPCGRAKWFPIRMARPRPMWTHCAPLA